MSREKYSAVSSEEQIAVAIEANRRLEIGRVTLTFVKRAMQDPVLRQQIKARAAEIRAENEKHSALVCAQCS